MEYEIITSSYIEEMIDKVNEEIKKGWLPQGGIAYNSFQSRYLQAMLKH